MPSVRRRYIDGGRTSAAAASLKFLVDNALPPRLAGLLIEAGYDAVHVQAYGMHAAQDEQILARALDEDRIVISADTDFGTILATQEANRPSFILFREPNLLLAHDYVNMLLPVLESLELALTNGCVVVFRKNRLRVRKLPFSA